MMLKPALLFSLLLLYSCNNSPEDRLGRLKHEFWEKFARQDFFEIKLKNDVLHLPLPPSSPTSDQQKALAESLYKEANSIDIQKLSAGSQKQLAQLRAALSDCVAPHGNAFFDPSRCTVSGHMQQFSGHAELPLLLEQIPAYFAQIEQNWQIPDARFITKAVDESQTTLDLLNGLEKNSGGALIDPARAAVKDFIGLCQSALLQ